MVAMAGDSYLLKVPTPPCQGQACRRATPSRSSSCGLVAYLVLLTGFVLALTAVAYYLRLELGALRVDLNSLVKDVKERELKMHAHIDFLHSEMSIMDTKLNRLNLVQQMKAFENSRLDRLPSDEEDIDFDADDEDDEKAEDLVYDDLEQTLPIGTARASPHDRHDSVPPLEPAGQRAGASATTANPDHHRDEADLDDGENLTDEVNDGDGGLGHLRRVRREVGSPDGRRVHGVHGEPQLKLYHMLQTPNMAAMPPPVPAEPWSYHSTHRAGRPQPMYAEHAPTDFVTAPRPPRRHSTLDPSTPVASMRRSRVMMDTNAAADSQASQAPQQRHHRNNRTGRRQRLQQQQQQQQQQQHYEAQLQDVSRDMVTGRSVESIDSNVEVAQSWRPYAPMVMGPAIAGHFVANTSRHHGAHLHHFDAQRNRHRHENGEYADWRSSPWMRDLGLDEHFTESGSHIVIKTPGLYLVYAQINFANKWEENGFWLYRNAERELLCVVTAVSDVEADKERVNTCFTAGVLRLERGDTLWLKDLSGAGERYRALDHSGRSFVGMVNLSTCRPKAESA